LLFDPPFSSQFFFTTPDPLSSLSLYLYLSLFIFVLLYHFKSSLFLVFIFWFIFVLPPPRLCPFHVPPFLFLILPCPFLVHSFSLLVPHCSFPCPFLFFVFPCPSLSLLVAYCLSLFLLIPFIPSGSLLNLVVPLLVSFCPFFPSH